MPQAPTGEAYFQQAEINQNVLLSLPEDRFDWRITLMFYTGLHLCNAVLRRNGVGGLPKNHLDRFDKLEKAPFPRGFRVKFEQLYDYSRTARYEIPTTNELLDILPNAIELYETIVKILKATIEYYRQPPPNHP